MTDDLTIRGRSGSLGEVTGHSTDIYMIDELRNYHVKKLLRKMGGLSVEENTQKLIKKAFSEYAEDIKDKNKGHNNDNNDEHEQRFNR